MLHESLNGLRLKQIGVVLERATKGIARISHGQHQIEQGSLAFRSQGLEGKSVHHNTSSCFASRKRRNPLFFSEQGLLKSKHRLEHRRTARIPLWLQVFNQLSEGIPLVLQGLQYSCPYIAQELSECRIRKQPRAHNYRINEVSEYVNPLRTNTSCYGRSNKDVLLATVTPQQYLENCQ